MSPAVLPILASATTLAAAAAGTATYAALSSGSQLFGPILIAPAHPRQIALTFDDGPNPLATPQLLDLLARHNVRATFFLIGQNARREPALVRRIAAEGHTLGNHTETHPWLQFLPERRIRAELKSCSQVLYEILGTPVTLFRPPHGARRPAVLRIARDLDLTPVNWNIIAGDWKPQTPEALHARLQQGIRRNRRHGQASNIVLHDGGLNQPRLPTVHAVARLLADQPQDTEFVTPTDWLPVTIKLTTRP